MEIASIKPFIAAMVPFIGAVLILAMRKHKNLREGCSLVAGVLMFSAVLSMIPSVLDGKTLHYTLFTFWPSVPIGFRVDGLGLLFAVTLFATMGMAFANNWFTLFLFYELITFFTYPLVLHHETKEALGRGKQISVVPHGNLEGLLGVAIISTVVMIVVSKAIGHAWLVKSEDYYD